MTSVDTVWSGLQNRGFEKLTQKKKGEPPAWRKTFDEEIYWDVYVADSLWNKHHFGCALSVAYHPKARDSWGDDEPFLIIIREHDFTPSGLEERGTPGAACWPLDAGSEFLTRLDAAFAGHFSACTTRERLLGEAIRQLEEFPRQQLLRLAIAFLQHELGQLSAARQNFDLYLDKFPHLRKLTGPLIDQLFA